MNIYILVAILGIVINCIPVKSKSQHATRLIISLTPLFLFGALRVDFGLDYNGYEDYFNEINFYGTKSEDRMEIGYYYLNHYLNSFRELIVIQTLFLCVSYYYLFKWYIPIKYTALGFLILYLTAPITIYFMLSGIRNSISISFLILSSPFIIRRKIFPFIGIMVLASLFHKSALMIFPIAYLIGNNKKIDAKFIKIWIGIMLFFALAASTIILDIASSFINNYFDRYETYVAGAKEMDKGAGLIISIFSITVSSLILYLFKNRDLTSSENILIKLCLVYFLSYLLGPLNMRLTQYFAPFFIAGSVMVLYKKYGKIDLRIAFIVLVIFYLVYAFNIWIKSPFFAYHNYESILNY